MADNEASAQEATVRKKVERIERQLDNLKSATRASYWVGRLVLLVLVIVILLQVWSLVNIFRHLDKKAYAEAAQEEFQGMVPKILDHAEDLAEKLAPVYSEAFVKEFDVAMPEITEKFSEELKTFVANVGDRIEKTMEKRFEQVLDKQLEILAEEMPELKDDAKRKEIMDNVLDCAYTAAQNLSNDLFQPQIKALADLGATLESVEIPAELRKMRDPQLLSYTLDKLGTLLMLKMTILEDVFVEPLEKEVKGK